MNRVLDRISRWLGLNAYRICERCGEADAVRFTHGYGVCELCWITIKMEPRIEREQG
jgi:hypothetical protein